MEPIKILIFIALVVCSCINILRYERPAYATTNNLLRRIGHLLVVIWLTIALQILLH